MMRGTIRRLFGSSLFLLVCSAACLYAGSLKAAGTAAAPDANPLARQFGGDPGDGWMLAGGFLVVVALAFASAGALLWSREREG